MRVAVLDDYLGLAEELAPWRSIPGLTDLVVLRRHVPDEAALAEALAGVAALSVMRERTPITATLLDRLRDLKLLVTTGMYNAAIDLDAATAAGVLVTGTGALASPTPELTIGLLLALVRDIPAQDRALRSGVWQTAAGMSLEGRRLGVVGLGRVGERVTRVALALGMEVVAWSQNLTRERAEALGAALVTKDELLATSDVVTLHVRLSERTRGMLGRDELARMRPDAYLINTSRGPLVDEAALIEALSARRIAGAALDVYDTEPLPADHPLLALDNAVLTPHLGYVTRDSLTRMYTETVENIAAYQAGTPIRVLNPEVAARPGRD
jgi:phosphoglycerate dehydrogenase-like enzyme